MPTAMGATPAVVVGVVAEQRDTSGRARQRALLQLAHVRGEAAHRLRRIPATMAEASAGPLHGVKIVELAGIGPAPYAA